MKRLSLIIVLIIGFTFPTTAQEIRDTNYSGYLFQKPFPEASLFFNRPQSGIMGLPFYYYDTIPHYFSGYAGYGYHTDIPLPIYGICTSVALRSQNTILPYDTIPDSAFMLVLVQKEGSRYSPVDSVYWRSRNPRSAPLLNYNFYDGPYTEWTHAYDLYFDHPVVVQDSFFVGMVFNKWELFNRWWDNGYKTVVFTGCFPCFYLTEECQIPSRKWTVLYRNYSPVEEDVHPFGEEVPYSWGALFPIIEPFVMDTAVCNPITGLHMTGCEMGYPSFAWDSAGNEDEHVELQYAPYDQDNWRTVEPTENPFRIYTNFDRSTYYKARIRARCHHGCPIHDTTMWSPWSDTILFHTGVTPPDTSTHDTTAINPVGNALPGLFTLTPNPTTGEVQVIVKSEKLKDKSCTVTVLDAAGHEVLRTTLNSQLSTLNLQSLPAGTYFVTLSDGTTTATQKLMIR